MKVRVFQAPHELKRLGPEDCPWSVQWRVNGRRQTKTLGDKEAAEDFAAVKKAELLNRVQGITTQKRWEDFVEEYLRDNVEATGKRPQTQKQIRMALDRFKELCKPKWVYEIDAKTLDQFCRLRFKGEGIHGQKTRPATVQKDLRHVRAALNIAKRWKYIAEVPALPEIHSDKREKPHVTEDHFVLLMKAADNATMPDMRIHDLPPNCTPGDWWRAMFATLWITGARIDAVLKMRWQDMEFETGRILSRATSTKQRADTRPDIQAAMPYLEKICGGDPRLLPWNHSERTLYREFKRIQESVKDADGNRLIKLVCLDAENEGHTCNEWCHVYGFHAFRYAHARLNYDNPQLQNQMGHACAATTEHYRKWAKRRLEEYGAKLPSMDEGEQQDEQQQQNDNTNSNKPRLRVFSA